MMDIEKLAEALFEDQKRRDRKADAPDFFWLKLSWAELKAHPSCGYFVEELRESARFIAGTMEALRGGE